MTDPPDSSISHSAALNYWSNVETSVSGVLGGYPQISRADLRGSQTFIGKLKRTAKLAADAPLARVADCGAGIGRVTAGCLSRVAGVVDVVEPVGKFCERARALGAEELGAGRVGAVYEVGLEEWQPEAGAYDLIWNQWCLGQLTDREVVGYLGRCRGGIKGHGWVCVKENLNSSVDGADAFDETDSSVTRSDESWMRLFGEAGFKVVMQEVQKGFPKQLGLYPVKMYALQPI